MAVGYDDIKEKRLGRQANIQKESQLQMQEELANEENNVIAEESTLNREQEEDASITAQAESALAQMEQIDADGGDIEQFISTLDPLIQERVMTIMNGGEANNGEVTPEEASFQPLQQGGGQQAPSQQPVPVTQQAQQIAQF